MIFGITGKKRVGKDTFGDYLTSEYGYVRFAFAGCIKRCINDIFLLDGKEEKKDKIDERWNISPRKLYQEFGTNIFRNNIEKFYPNLQLSHNIWIERFIKFVELNKNKNIIVTDVRFQDEADIIKSYGGIIIKVIRDTKLEKDTHISENVNVKYNILIKNNSSIKEYKKNIKKKLGNLLFAMSE
jgi:hypothetical protein